MTEAETKRVDVPVLQSLGPQSPWTPHNPWTVLGRGQAGALGRTSCGLDRACFPLMTESQQQDFTQSYSHPPSKSSMEFQPQLKRALKSWV